MLWRPPTFLEPRASVRALPDPVLGEGGAGSEDGGVSCGGVASPWESVLNAGS